MDKEQQIQEMKEVFNDANKVKDALSKANVNTKEFIHAIPVLLNIFYKDKPELMDISKSLIKEVAIMHDLLYKKN